MGNVCSTKSGESRDKRARVKKKNSKNETNSELPQEKFESDPEEELFPHTIVDEEDERELEELNTMRKWLHEDLPMFVINNVLMSVQFFKNFEEEIIELRAEAKADGKELETHRMKHLQADKLMERVGTRVVFRPRHGPLKNTETLLHPLRSFLVYQNVQVEWDKELKLGTPSQQTPFYRLQTEDLEDQHLHNAGYLNLRELESQQEEVIYETIDGFVTPNSSQIPRQTNNAPATPRVSDATPRISNATPRSSVASDPDIKRLATRLRQSLLQIHQPEDPLYGYTTIQSLTAPRSIHDVRRGEIPSSSCSIPKENFTEVKKPLLVSTRRTGMKGPLLSTISYLNSAKFQRHFLDVLAERLAEPLHLSRELNNAPVQGGYVVVCQGKATHHITPILQAPFWPDAGVTFFHRGVDRDFAWPTQHMMRRVQKMGVHVLPLGYLKRRGHNPDFELQWHFICPRAEEYLLLHTMHAHIRCYLFTLTIFKSFLKLEDTILGLNHTHILHLLFWELQNDFMQWPEDRPAEKLLDFLKVLYKAIEDRKIRHFFIDKRNLLESSPFLFLNKAQGTLARLLENPLPFILLAVKNLRMRFYPELDVTYIYKLVTTKNVLYFLNPNLVPKKRRRMSYEDEDMEALDKETQERLWKEEYLRQRKEEKLAQQQSQKGSTETINLQEMVEKNDAQDAAAERRKILLEKFIPHFIELGRRSMDYKAFEQSQMYLLHAKRLTCLLAEEVIDPAEIKTLEEVIKNEQIKSDKMAMQGNRSSTEVRKDEEENKGTRLSLLSRGLPEVPAN